MSIRPMFYRTASVFAVLYAVYLFISGCYTDNGEVLTYYVKTMPSIGSLPLEQGICPEISSVIGNGTAGGITGNVCFDEKVIL